jgi:hypothetical protein
VLHAFERVVLVHPVYDILVVTFDVVHSLSNVRTSSNSSREYM